MSSSYDYKKYAVLYVDDESQSLKYFPKLFGDSFRCLTAESVAKAREVLAKEGDTIGVVISYQRMPGETGGARLSWLPWVGPPWVGRGARFRSPFSFASAVAPDPAPRTARGPSRT